MKATRMTQDDRRIAAVNDLRETTDFHILIFKQSNSKGMGRTPWWKAKATSMSDRL
jgi:hypothetical protein